ncbi:MAG: Bsp6I family type II restriction endonuclease [Candidatus Hodarchaeales archaeon]
MREGVITARLGGVNSEVDLLYIEESDRHQIRRLYDIWRELTDGMHKFKSRAPNLLEGISESAFCLEFNAARALNVRGSPGSFDTLDLKTFRRQQIKATSVDHDLTSFGPNSVWDDLYFLDFYREGKWDGSFDVYQISDDLIYNHIVNKGKKETFKDQQEQGRRPRLSVLDIIAENNIPVLKTCRL